MNDTTYEAISLQSAKLILEELHREADIFWEAANAADGKAASLLGWASLLTGFISALNLPNWSVSNPGSTGTLTTSHNYRLRQE